MKDEIKNDLPTDTVLDSNDTMSQEARDTMKAIYLYKAKSANLPSEGLTPTEIIDGMEELRAAGLLRVQIDEFDKISIAVISPTGKVVGYI